MLSEVDYRAYCATGEGGGVKNSCSSASGGTSAKPDESWKSQDGRVEWDADQIRKSPPVAGGEQMSAVTIRDSAALQEFQAEMDGLSLSDMASLSGGNIRGGTVEINAYPKQTVALMSATAPVDPSADDDGAGSNTVSFAVAIGKTDEGEKYVDYQGLYSPQDVSTGGDKSSNLRVSSLMQQKFLESMITAESKGFSHALTYAAGDRTDGELHGYRLWPQFGFDGEINWREKKIPADIVLKAAGVSVPSTTSPSMPQAALVGGSLLRVGRKITVQQLISFPEGKAWWQENGSDIELRLDFSDTQSDGYKRYEKKKKLAARLKERNKSRSDSWLVDAAESRGVKSLGDFDVLWEIQGELDESQYDFRAYCATGEGGGIKNTCSSADGQGSDDGKQTGKSSGDVVDSIVRSQPTTRSDDGRTIIKSGVPGARIFKGVAAKEYIETVAAGAFLESLQQKERGGRINSGERLTGTSRDYVQNSLSRQTQAAMARGVVPAFYSPEELERQLEEFKALVPQVRGGRTKDGVMIEQEDAEHLFRVVQALTSPNASPFQNMQRTDSILSKFFSGDGQITTGDKLGVTGAGIQKSLARYQRIIDVLGRRPDGSVDVAAGVRGARELLTGRVMRAGDIDGFFGDFYRDGDKKNAWKPSSYLVSEVVPVFSTFGPKVGPFFANNHGELDHLTADIWFTRTWGRATGELLVEPSPSAAKEKSSELLRVLKRAKPEQLHGIDPDQLRASIEQTRETGVVSDTLRAWSSARLKHYAAGDFKEKSGTAGSLNRLAKNIVENDLSLMGDPGSGKRRNNMLSVMRDVSKEVGQPVAYVQDMLWQDEQDAYHSLGAMTQKTAAGELSLYSGQIAKIARNPKDRKPMSRPARRSIGGETQAEPFDDYERGGREQLLWEAGLAGVSDAEFVEALLAAAEKSVTYQEYQAEQRNFFALDVEQRESDCGRDDGGRFGDNNDCQASASGGKDRNKSARDTARGISGPIASDDPRIKGEKKPFTPSSEPNSNFVSVPSDEKVREALSSDKQANFAANRKLSDGHPVDLRIDIPAFERKEVYAVTVHEQTGTKRIGSPIGYDSVVRLSGDVSFSTNEHVATQIALGHQKTPLATVRGNFSKSRDIPVDIDSWAAVGFDPKKAAFFYDKKSGEEIVGGEDAISIGNSVFVRKPRKGGRSAKSDYRSNVGFWGLESRDCGRDDGGRFGAGNECASGDGGDSPLLSSSGKVGWFGDQDAKPFAGAEKYGEITVSDGKKVGESLSRSGLELADVIAAAGATANSYVWSRPANEFSGLAEFSGGTPVFVGFTSDVGGVKNGLESTAVIGVDKNGRKTLQHNVMDVLPEVKASASSRHAAARAFYRSMIDSVSASEMAGVSEVRFSAAGKPGSKDGFRGYTIWPRMGFDGAIPPDISSKLPERLSHVKSLLELHATKEGTRWWAENGRDVDVSMVLGDRSTPQRKVFDRFARRLSGDKREMALGDGSSDEWLSPEDLVKFDDAWQEIWDEGDLDDYEYVESRSADCGRTDNGRFDKGNQCQTGADTVAAAARSGASHDELVSAISAAIGTKRGWLSGAEKGDSKPSQVLAAIGVTVENAAEIDKYHASSSQKTREGIAHAIAECHAAVKADPSLKSVKFSIMTAGSLADKYGTAESRWAGVSGTFSPADGALHILAGTVPSQLTNDVLYRAGYSSTPSPAHTLIHEVAHRDHFDSIAKAMNSPRPAGDSLKVRDAWAASLRDESNRRLVEAARKDSEWVDRADQKVRSLGIYATADALEFYAEYATAVKLGYAKNDPDLDKMCKAMLAPVPKRLKK